MAGSAGSGSRGSVEVSTQSHSRQQPFPGKLSLARLGAARGPARQGCSVSVQAAEYCIGHGGVTNNLQSRPIK